MLFAAGLSFVAIAAPSGQAQDVSVAEGRDLFVASCASCHGVEGTGTTYGPPIADTGAAAADFQLRTGRMPLADPAEQTLRKPPAFSPEQIESLVAYVASLGDGPPVPSVTLEGADVALGQQIFVANCAACHGATANGGVAGDEALAPSLYDSFPIDVVEATITGPGEMPVFAFDPEERNAVAAFIDYLQNESAPGGADIGGVGPVPEGFVAWAVGMSALALVCYVIGAGLGRKS